LRFTREPTSPKLNSDWQLTVQANDSAILQAANYYDTPALVPLQARYTWVENYWQGTRSYFELRGGQRSKAVNTED